MNDQTSTSAPSRTFLGSGKPFQNERRRQGLIRKYPGESREPSSQGPGGGLAGWSRL